MSILPRSDRFRTDAPEREPVEMLTSGVLLGEVLRRARRRLRWSLREAALHAGLSNGYLSLIENGRVRQPTPGYLAGLARAYGLAYGDLMTLAGWPLTPAETPPDLHPHVELSDAEEAELRALLVEDVSTLSLRRIELVRAFIAGLCSQ